MSGITNSNMEYHIDNIFCIQRQPNTNLSIISIVRELTQIMSLFVAQVNCIRIPALQYQIKDHCH